MNHPLHGVWAEMINRTTNPNHRYWHNYGGRGITICDRWRNDFWAFVDDVGERPEGTLSDGRAAYSLDRVDNSKGYDPQNFRWADVFQQAQNRRPPKPKGSTS